MPECRSAAKRNARVAVSRVRPGSHACPGNRRYPQSRKLPPYNRPSPARSCPYPEPRPVAAPEPVTRTASRVDPGSHPSPSNRLLPAGAQAAGHSPLTRPESPMPRAPPRGRPQTRHPNRDPYRPRKSPLPEQSATTRRVTSRRTTNPPPPAESTCPSRARRVRVSQESPRPSLSPKLPQNPHPPYQAPRRFFEGLRVRRDVRFSYWVRAVSCSWRWSFSPGASRRERKK